MRMIWQDRSAVMPHRISTKIKKNPLLVIACALYVGACCSPALLFKDSQGPLDTMFGLRALAVGWSGVFAGVVGWYANPVCLLGVYFTFIHKPVPAMLAGIVAVAIACTTFGLLGRELPADEGLVNKTTVIKILPGCYLWLASMALLPVAAVFARQR
jgi:hypothetical protein